MAISIQFEGIDDVLNALKNRNCPNWGLFQGRQFLFKSRPGNSMEESLQLLEEILQSLVDNPVIYTLKVYEDDDVKINEKAICDGSFNFKVVDEEQMQIRKERRYGGGRGMSRMDAIEKKLDQLLGNDDDDDDSSDSMTGIEPKQNWDKIIMGYVENPSKLQQLFDALKSGQGLLTGETMLPALIGNVHKIGSNEMGQNNQVTPAPAPGSGNNLSHEENMHRLSKALDTLGMHDPNIIDNLEKLAKLASDKPDTYKMAVQMLNGM